MELVRGGPGSGGPARPRTRSGGPGGRESVPDPGYPRPVATANPRELPTAVPDGERILTWRDVYDLPELPHAWPWSAPGHRGGVRLRHLPPAWT